MSNGAEKHPKTSNPVHAAYKIDASHAPANASVSVLGRFVRRVIHLFTPPESVEIKLTGRIHELQPAAAQLLHDLSLLRDKVEHGADPRLYSLLSGIIDPITKEILRLQKVMERQGDAPQRVKTYTRYVEWVEKARRWIELGSQDIEGIQKAVIKQTINDFELRIDRDIQIIQDYLNHALSNLTISDDLKTELKQKLAPALSPHILNLTQLKEHPRQLSLEALIPWRSGADSARETHFSSALHAIDTYFTEIIPAGVSETETELSVALLMKLIDLETRIAKVVSEFESENEMDEASRIALVASIERIESQTHELTTDLNLSHEYGERLQKSLNTLISIREQLTL